MNSTHREIEARFLDIDPMALKARLNELGAMDHGEEMFSERIFHDALGTWAQEGKRYIRIRITKKGTFLTFKCFEKSSVDGTREIELMINSADHAEALLKELGITLTRAQEKKRHSFQLGDVMIDFDTWPSLPPYVELEGPNEDALKTVASQIGLDWSAAVFDSALVVIENHYHLPVSGYKYFTFDRIG